MSDEPKPPGASPATSSAPSAQPGGPSSASSASSPSGASSSSTASSPSGASSSSGASPGSPTAPAASAALSSEPTSNGARRASNGAAAKGSGASSAPAIPGLRVGLTVAAVAWAALSIGALVLAPGVRAAGLPAYAGVFFGAASLSLSLVSLVLLRRARRIVAPSAIAALLGALACASSGLAAHAARTPKATPDELVDPVLRAWSLGEAEARARAGAEVGLAGVPGALLGLVGVWLALDDRRRARALASTASPPAESVPLAVASFVGVTLATLGGVGLDVRALTESVTRIEHPHVAKLHAVLDAYRAADMPAACERLEAALAPDFVPADVLERELPDYREIAVRCVTLRIDALPKGLACVPEAGRLAATGIVRAASATDRVKRACPPPL